MELQATPSTPASASRSRLPNEDHVVCGQRDVTPRYWLGSEGPYTWRPGSQDSSCSTPVSSLTGELPDLASYRVDDSGASSART
jgi:hypothetical protein